MEWWYTSEGHLAAAGSGGLHRSGAFLLLRSGSIPPCRGTISPLGARPRAPGSWYWCGRALPPCRSCWASLTYRAATELRLPVTAPRGSRRGTAGCAAAVRLTALCSPLTWRGDGCTATTVLASGIIARNAVLTCPAAMHTGSADVGNGRGRPRPSAMVARRMHPAGLRDCKRTMHPVKRELQMATLPPRLQLWISGWPSLVVCEFRNWNLWSGHFDCSQTLICPI